MESGGPYEKAKLHAGCSAGVEQLYGPSINCSLVYSLEQWYEDVHLEVVTTGQDVGLKFSQTATGSMD